MIFDRERPGMRKSGPAAKSDVLNRQEKFPERKHLRILAPRRQEKVDRENDKVGWKNPQGAAGKEFSEFDRLAARDWSEELPADEITAENKKKIYSDPAEAVGPAGKRKPHDPGVVERYDEDRERSKKIETGLALAVCEPRVDFGRRRTEVRGQNRN